MTTNDEILLLSSLDQPIPTDDDWVLDRIDEIIQKSIEQHNAFIALNVIKQLYGIGKTSGLGLAKALYLTNKHWGSYNVGDEFTSTVLSYTGLHSNTIDRYIGIWAMFVEGKIPEELAPEIRQRNMMELFPIAKAVEQGYEFTTNEWQKLADASDYSEIKHIVQQEIKGVEPRKNSIQLYLDNKGTLWAFQQGERYFIGALEISDDRDTVQKAITRILHSAGIMKQ